MNLPQINFLNDDAAFSLSRAEDNPTIGGVDPLLLGAIVPVVALVLVAGITWFYGAQINSKTEELNQITNQAAALQSQVLALRNQQKQLQEIQARSQAVMNLFDLSKPWSAVLEDLRRRVPANLWLESFTTKDNQIQISGQALDYTQVAAFQLTLGASPFTQTVILQDSSQQVAQKDTLATVSYKLSVRLTNQGLGQFAQTLEETGSVGLLEKLRRLQKERLIP